MSEDEIDKRGRATRFERWEKLGLEQVKHDLLNGGQRVIGGTPGVRELAWEWVRMNQVEINAAAQKPPEILMLKPAFYGVEVLGEDPKTRARSWIK